MSFSCEISTSGSKTLSRSYSSSLSVTVVPNLPLALGVPITWILPPHYTTTSLLPSSSESYTQFSSQNRKGTINYSLLRSAEKNDALQIDAIFINGDRIKTTASNNVACIQAKDHTTGRTEIASCVKVAEVWHLIIHLLLVGATCWHSYGSPSLGWANWFLLEQSVSLRHQLLTAGNGYLEY